MKRQQPSRTTPCQLCPFGRNEAFRRFSPEELEFVGRFKSGELVALAGTTVLSEGAPSEQLYTVLSGWGFRHKLLENGRRQILNFCMPGDLIGLQASIEDKMGHSVEALSDMVLCVLPRVKLWELFRGYPGLAFDVTWLAAREERILDEHLLSVGQRTAEQRAAYLLLYLFARARIRKLTRGNSIEIPLTQRHLADALGLSLVHTNRVLNRLVRRGVLKWESRFLTIDTGALSAIADWSPDPDRLRPYI